VNLERRSEPRIALRPVRPRDAVLLTRWRSEDSVRRYQPLPELSTAQIRADLERQRIGDLYRMAGDKYQWVIEADNEPAGWMTLVVINWEHGLAEVGYALSHEFQGRGLMPVALNQLLADLFLNTTLERIEARCAIGNVPSQKVLERVGFTREGRLRAYFKLRGERIDNYIYAILRRDFLPH